MKGFVATLVGFFASCNAMTGTYFPNWAQYRQGEYAFKPSSLQPVINKLDIIWYAFAYFCPDSNMIQPYWMVC